MAVSDVYREMVGVSVAVVSVKVLKYRANVSSQVKSCLALLSLVSVGSILLIPSRKSS